MSQFERYYFCLIGNQILFHKKNSIYLRINQPTWHISYNIRNQSSYLQWQKHWCQEKRSSIKDKIWVPTASSEESLVNGLEFTRGINRWLCSYMYIWRLKGLEKIWSGLKVYYVKGYRLKASWPQNLFFVANICLKDQDCLSYQQQKMPIFFLRI